MYPVICNKKVIKYMYINILCDGCIVVILKCWGGGQNQNIKILNNSQ